MEVVSKVQIHFKSIMFSNEENGGSFTEEFQTRLQRQQFVRRVFALLTLGLLLTVVQAFAAMEM